MINKKLINLVPESKKYIFGNVLFQWISLIANMVIITIFSQIIARLYNNEISNSSIKYYIAVIAVTGIVRYFSAVRASRMGYLASKSVKKILREIIFNKLLRLGQGYSKQVKTSEVVQVAVEGVEQLDVYFGSYLPQFFYAILAPLTLFLYLAFINFHAAIVLLICVPLIPISIAAVQTWAKKLLYGYWGQYTNLGDKFLENLQGLTTLKIYSADEFKNNEMNEQAEKFRKITMKVLVMQLNSITIMDVIAYGGAALGIVIAAVQLKKGNIGISETLITILIAADYFIPMRLLGSFFHIAMNGMAASEKIFNILDLQEEKNGEIFIEKNASIVCRNLGFSYSQDRRILSEINMEFQNESLCAIVGVSGCGKSTIAGILTGKNTGYTGEVLIGKDHKVSLHDIRKDSLIKNITYIGHESYIFKGTLRENLKMGDSMATDEALWEALEKTKIDKFFKDEKGLDTEIREMGENLSGGQRQRVAIARALLHDSQIYIFDEATSNVDVESEVEIVELIENLAKHKTVIIISHRLANVIHADKIYVMEKGSIVENGTHDELLNLKGKYVTGAYKQLWNCQNQLENFEKYHSEFNDPKRRVKEVKYEK
ncbi:ABC transporter ATP-binding protein/permease [Eubacteriales bacterium KG127]